MTDKDMKDIYEHIISIKKTCDDFQANGLENGFERGCNYEELVFIDGLIDQIISLMAVKVD